MVWYKDFIKKDGNEAYGVNKENSKSKDRHWATNSRQAHETTELLL